MPNVQRTLSPIDGHLVAERSLASDQEIASALVRAEGAQALWKHESLGQRIAVCRRFAEIMKVQREELGQEITLQMGRPSRYTAGEIDGLVDRAATMCDLAETQLADVVLPPKTGFIRSIRREPVGVVFAIVPWNYPYLTAVNTVIPALLAGNSVILKHSPQTPLCAERIHEVLVDAGLPEGIFQFLHLSDNSAEALVRNPAIDFVSFTGSVGVGRKLEQAAAGRFIGLGLELGGKDAAYVRADADVAFAVENIVDGICFNSGQSCCAVERVYVHTDVYDEFVAEAASLASRYVLGDPRDPATTLGPVVSARSAAFIRSQVAEAIAAGAKPLVDENLFPKSAPGSLYVAPQLLVDVDHSMSLMRDETFGPVAGIMRVPSDEEALALINDSEFGLTASVWTSDLAAAQRLGDCAEVGTWFMNRCDYLDPLLAWTGVKNSGHGCTLSEFGFDQLTRPKSFHFRTHP